MYFKFRMNLQQSKSYITPLPEILSSSYRQE